LLNKRHEVFVCTRAAGSCNCMWISTKQNALCELCSTFMLLLCSLF